MILQYVVVTLQSCVSMWSYIEDVVRRKIWNKNKEQQKNTFGTSFSLTCNSIPFRAWRGKIIQQR